MAARATPLNGGSALEASLGALHAAALDDERWPAAASAIDAYTGARGGFLVTGDGQAPGRVDIFFARFCLGGERRTDLERLYFRTYHAIDERLPRIRRLPDSKVVHVSSLFTDTERKRSAMFNEALPLSRCRDSLTVRLDGPGGQRIVWVVADPLGRGGWSASQRRAVERLLPHLRQYVRVRQTLADAQALASSMTGLIENRSLGIVRLDRRGRVVQANDRARALLNAGDGIRDEQGLLRATGPNDDKRLQTLLAGALPSAAGPAAGGSLLVLRKPPQPRLAVHVVPAGGAGAPLRGARLGALVLLDDPAAGPGMDPERVARLLHLTPAQSRVAVLLAQGRDIDAVAAATGCSRTTVKWHIKHIYAKHGLSRQVELAHLVRSLPGERERPDRKRQAEDEDPG